MKIKLTFLAITLSYSALAQPRFKEGIYKDSIEIVKNTPSGNLNYDIITISKTIKRGSKKTEERFYKLSIKKKEARSLGKILGFSDGEKLYLTASPTRLRKKDALFDPNTLFSPVERINDSIFVFSQFQGAEYTNEYTPWHDYSNVSNDVSFTNSYQKRKTQSTNLSFYSLNKNNGSMKMLTEEYISNLLLLSSDEKLHSKFEKEKHKEDLLLLYLIKLLDDGKN